MAPVTPNPESTAIKNGFSALPTDVASNTVMLKSLLGVIRLNMDTVSLVITKYSTDWGLDT